MSASSGRPAHCGQRNFMPFRSLSQPRRVLVVDDNRHIHVDFRRILVERMRVSNTSALELELFGETAKLPMEAGASDDGPVFEMDSAYQGEEALAMVERAVAEDRPYPMAFMDVRMPPGWDGIETTER